MSNPIYTKRWDSSTSYQKYEPVLFDYNIVQTGQRSSKQGLWSFTHNNYRAFTTSVATFNIFKLHRLSNYNLSARVRLVTDATTQNKNETVVKSNGVGLRMAFYDAAGDEIFAGVNEIGVHKLLAINELNLSNWQYLDFTVPYREIPAFGTVAESGALELVVYVNGMLTVDFADPKIVDRNAFYYATQTHTSSSDNSPTGANTLWTKDFQFKPSYGSNVSIKSNNVKTVYGDGYTREIQRGVNGLTSQFQLNFDARTDFEAKAIMNYLESKKGAEPFFFTPPDPYNQQLPFFCEEFGITKSYKDNNSVQATFLCDTQTTLTRDEIFLSESVSKNRFLNWSAQDYTIHDVVQYTGDQRFYYKKTAKNTDNTISPKNDDDWTTDHFYWKPSIGFNVKKDLIIEKANFSEKYTERSSNSLNQSPLILDLSFNNRDDKETAAILHFIEQKRGYKAFKMLPPDPYKRRIDYSGSDKTITGAKDLYYSLSVGDHLLFKESGNAYPEIERKILDIEFVTGTDDVYLSDAISKITLDSGINSNFTNPVTGGAGDNFIYQLKDFVCNEWGSNYIFKDNNSVRGRFVENNFKWKRPPDIKISGPKFIDYNSPVEFSFNIKSDGEPITGYRLYDPNGSVPSYSGTDSNDYASAGNLTFSTSGINTVRLDAQNRIGVHSTLDYEVVVGGDLTTNIEVIGGDYNISENSAITLRGEASSFKFVSGIKSWWSDESEPAEFSSTNFTNTKVTKYNEYLTGFTNVSVFRNRYFKDETPGTYTFNFSAIDKDGNTSTKTKNIELLDTGVLSRIYFTNSNNGVYNFDEKYFKTKTVSNANFSNTGDMLVIAGVSNITGQVTYNWTHLSTVYSDAADIEAAYYLPVGSIGISGNYLNVGAKLLSSTPTKDTTATLNFRCDASGFGGGETFISGGRDVKVVFRWEVD